MISVEDWQKYRKLRLALLVGFILSGSLGLVIAVPKCNTLFIIFSMLNFIVGILFLSNVGRRLAIPFMFLVIGSQRLTIHTKHDEIAQLIHGYIMGTIMVFVGVFFGIYELIAWRKKRKLQNSN